MGGSGGGFGPVDADDIRRWLDDSQAQSNNVEHDAYVSDQLTDILAQYNDRPVDEINDRLAEIQEAIEEAAEIDIQLRFGGSIAKHTYVDGLSDIDALAILKDSNLAEYDASEVLEVFWAILRAQLVDVEDVTIGQLAVTVEYSDGMQIQILPAVQDGNGIRIPDAVGDGWSRVIQPQRFANKLTEINRQCSGKLIPLIKLVKGAIAQFPEPIRPNGYHIESLAIEAFKNYQGPMNTKDMIRYFFEHSSSAVLTIIRDSTHQSLNVDSYFGPDNSDARKSLSGALSRIATRLDNADRANSADDWMAAIGE